jgi:hypothetical protein
MTTTGSASQHAEAWHLEINLGRDDRAMLEAGQGIEVVVSGDDPGRTVFNVILHPVR